MKVYKNKKEEYNIDKNARIVSIGRGWKELVKDPDVIAMSEPLTLDKLKKAAINAGQPTISVSDLYDYLMDIFKMRKNDKRDIVIGRYCPHQDRLITISNNPNKNMCNECMGEIMEKYMK